MPKYCGYIGYAITDEIRPGVWQEEIRERKHYGDINRNRRNLQSSGSVNDNLTISNELSIIADPFARDNFHAMRYAEYMGTKWKITNVEVQYPRLILTLSEVWNGQTT